MRLSLALAVLVLVPGAPDLTPPVVAGFSVRADGRAFAGDRPLLATISPNGDGFRERAAISFRLSCIRRAATSTTSPRTIFATATPWRPRTT